MESSELLFTADGFYTFVERLSFFYSHKKKFTGLETAAVRNILIPIDGTERSMKAVDLVKSLYLPEDVNLVLLMVREDIASICSSKEFEKAESELKSTLDAVAKQLPGFKIKKEIVVGRAGEEILECADQNGTDIIVMTKSTKDGWSQMIGSVAAHVVKYAHCIVMIVPENGSYDQLSRKTVRCRHMDDIVTLGSQISLKPSSCLLPVQAGKCSYAITVLQGRMRLNHQAFNPDGDMWNSAPREKQPHHYDLKEGEEKEIQVEILVDYNRLDQMEAVNPSMTEPLKFHYVVHFENSEES